MTKNGVCYIGVDFGTQGVRCGIVDAKGNVLNACEVAYPTQYPAPGWAAQDPADWLNRFDEAMTQCLKEADPAVISSNSGNESVYDGVHCAAGGYGRKPSL